MRYNRLTTKGSYYDKDDHELDLVIELDEHYYEEVQDIKVVCEKLNRLVELEDKIENGTIIELPCKVGTKVFYIQMDYNDDGILYYDIEEVEFDMWCMNYWNKWIFLTKTEAEQRLKELQKK